MTKKKHNTRCIQYLYSAISIVFFVPIIAFAANDCGRRFCNPIRFDNLRDFLVAILNVIVQISFPIIVLAIIYTGFLFVSARGAPDKLTRAKSALAWTLVGSIIVLGAFVLANGIKGTVDEIRGVDAGRAHIATSLK